MTKRLLFPVILGVGGIAILLWLGFWQVDRLAWKEGILADLDARISADPVPLPDAPDPASDNYKPVTLTATPDGQELHVLVSGTAAGTGYRAIAAATTADDRRVMLDLGLLPLDAKDATAPQATADITGNLIWPDDINSSTPEPDLDRNIWFGRDVAAMAAALDTAPILIVVRQMSPADPRVTPLPVDTSTIKNDHWEYAVTWFLLAIVWAAMTGYLIFRTLRTRDS